MYKKKILLPVISLLLLISTSAFAGDLAAENFRRQVKEGLQNKEETIEVTYSAGHDEIDSGDISYEIMQAREEAGDYIKFTTQQWEMNIKAGQEETEVTIDVNYHSSEEEDERVFLEVKQTADELFSEFTSDHSWIKNITDHIARTVRYDDSKTRYSAYNAVENGITTCNGYALLTYLYLKEAGIKARIIEGELEGEDHAWNMVQLNGRWYHLDLTQISAHYQRNGELVYDEYLVTDKALRASHSWDESDYPQAVSDYSRGLNSDPDLEQELRLHLLEDEYTAATVDELADMVLGVIKKEESRPLFRLMPEICNMPDVQQAMDIVKSSGDESLRSVNRWRFSVLKKYIRDEIPGSGTVQFEITYN
ncbi:MAG: transglutaminase domain-containing protein [Halanaerobiaceae bacterium]